MARAPLVAALAVAVGLVSSARPAASESTCLVKYERDRLTVHVDAVPLTDVVREIGRQTGAEIVGVVLKPRQVTQQLDDIPVADGLMRLLGDQNFTLRYGASGELREIDLRGESLVATPASAPGDAPNGPSARRSASHGRDADTHISREVTSDGRVIVSVRNSGQRSARRRGRTRESEESPQSPGVVGVPVAAAGTGATPAASTPDQSSQDQQPTADDLERKLRRSFLGNLEQMSDADLANYLTTPEGQHVAALLQYYALHHPSSNSSQRANGIIDRVPGVTPTPRAHH